MKMGIEDAELLVKATGQGAWGKIEVDRNRIVARVADIKQFDGPANVYFTRDREQVVSGNMYATVGLRNPLRLRESTAYMVYTHLEIPQHIPAGYRGVIDPVPEMVEAGLMYMPTEIPEGTTGVVRIPVFSLRRMSIVEMAAVGYFSIEHTAPESKPNQSSTKSTQTSKSKTQQKSKKSDQTEDSTE